MKDMCDFCGKESRLIYPFDPAGELNMCEDCDGLHGPTARGVAFKVKNNISKNMVRFLEQECFYAGPDIKEWIKRHYKLGRIEETKKVLEESKKNETPNKKMIITKQTRRSGEIYFVASFGRSTDYFETMEDAMAWFDRMQGFEIASEEIVYEKEI